MDGWREGGWVRVRGRGHSRGSSGRQGRGQARCSTPEQRTEREHKDVPSTHLFPPAPGPHRISDYYKLSDSVLGSGSFAVVIKCWRLRDNKLFACKRVSKSRLNKRTETALKFEFLLLKELQHPYIVNMYDFFEDDEYFYLVLDFCEGKELFDMIVKLDGYAEKDAREVVRRLADALAFCHANGIIHRDLKPENVLLSKKDDIQSAKLIDFGFAAAFEQKMGLRLHAAAPQLNTLCGTVGYLAPEVINKKVTCEWERNARARLLSSSTLFRRTVPYSA